MVIDRLIICCKCEGIAVMSEPSVFGLKGERFLSRFDLVATGT